MNCWGGQLGKIAGNILEKTRDEIVRTWKNKEISEFNFEDSINFFSQIIRIETKP